MQTEQNADHCGQTQPQHAEEVHVNQERDCFQRKNKNRSGL